MDYFALLNEPRAPWLDPEALKAAFHARSATAHPDRVHGGGVAEKAEATGQFADLNAAYQCLREPKERLLHLLELETGRRTDDLGQNPAEAVDLFFTVARALQETDRFLAARAQTASALARVQMFAAGMDWTDKLNALSAQIQLRREGILAELKEMNAAWKSAPPPGSAERPAALPLGRLEQAARLLSFYRRWAEQLQERAGRLAAD